MKSKAVLNFWMFALVVLFAAGCSNETKNESSDAKNEVVVESSSETKSEKSNSSIEDIKPQKITAAQFKELVWDYEANPEEWKYEGELPCVVDFYADWCKPCKMVAPIMDDLADEYDGRLLIYKVNTDEERELASVFQVRSIPSILFAPKSGKPAMQPGALSKEDYKGIIDDFVLKLNKDENDKKQS